MLDVYGDRRCDRCFYVAAAVSINRLHLPTEYRIICYYSLNISFRVVSLQIHIKCSVRPAVGWPVQVSRRTNAWASNAVVCVWLCVLHEVECTTINANARPDTTKQPSATLTYRRRRPTPCHTRVHTHTHTCTLNIFNVSDHFHETRQ